MIAKIENGVVTQWPLGEHHIQSVNPDVSFSFPLTDETLRDFGYARFEHSDPAQYDAEFQEAREVAPVLNGVVATQAWEIVEKYTADEKAAYIAKRDADRLAAAQAAVRAERNDKLAESDWTQGKDIPDSVSTKWATYRQALRDVPQQADFPNAVVWPQQPE